MVEREEGQSFPELPILVIHDSILSDILGGKEVTEYKESAIFIEDYFLIRQALLGMDSGKSGITTTQVFKEFEKFIGEKTNTLQAIKDWVDKTSFGAELEHLGVRTSVYVYSHFTARRNVLRIGQRVILICNDKDIEKKLLFFYNQSGWNFRNIGGLPFAIMNTEQLKEHLELIDKDNFNLICEIIESTKSF